MRIVVALAALGLTGAAAFCQAPAAKAAPKAKPESAAARTAPAAAAPAGVAASVSALNKSTLEQYVRNLFIWGPEIAVAVADPKPGPMPGFHEVTVTGSANGVSLDEVFYVSADGKKIVRGTVYDAASSPFQRERGLIKTDLSPSLGTPGASVVIVLYSDFQCNFCRQEAKMIRDNVIKTFPNDVRIYFKDHPLDKIHPWARNASIAGRCVFRQNAKAFWDYHDWIFENQQQITPENLRTKVMEWAGGKKLDTMQLGRCFDSKSTDPEINKSLAEGKALKVSSTPTMFINGRPIAGSIDWNNLKQVIEWELKQAKASGEAAEKCCELALPSPLGAPKK